MRRVAILLTAFALFPAALGAAEMEFGFGKAEITPDRPLRLSGYGNRTDVSTGVEQKLWTRVLAIRSAGQVFVLANVDSIGFPPLVTQTIFEKLKQQHGLSREQFVLCATHSHTAPQLAGGLHNLFAKELTEAEAQQTERYTKILIDQVVAATGQAIKDLAPGRLYWGQTQATFAANRRVLKDGKWTGFGVQKEGPTDHAVPVLKVTDRDGKLRGVVVNYACHCTTLGPGFNRICGDWAGYAAENLEAAHTGITAVVTIGCGADTNPEPRGELQMAKDHGKQLSTAVDKLLAGKLTELTSPLRAAFDHAALPFDAVDQAALKQAAESNRPQIRRHAERFLAMKELPADYPCPVQVWRFGDQAAMVFLGGEVVVDYALRLKKELAPLPLWVSAYANDVYGYLASERMRSEAGYEVDFSMIYYNQPGRWASGTEDVVIWKVLDLVQKTGAGAKQNAQAPGDAAEPLDPRLHQVKLNGHTFTLPKEFDIELAAAPPLADRPITASFDEHGRLYVADSSGSNEPTRVQLSKKPHRIVRLEDTDGDGKFDKSSVFADRMMFPEGTLWFDGSLYVAAPPSIWKLTDTNHDGVADRREEWHQGKTLTGCANDLHGPYLGPDGWIYWAKGAFAKQEYTLANGKPFSTRASHIFRCRPDGTGIEPVMTGGMDNPVEVAFTPGGERLFTTTFFQHPGNGQRDGLIHAVYGGVYGKVHDVIYEHPWTGPEVMPVLVHLGAAAPTGLLRFESDGLGADHRDNVFATLFNMQKVTRHVLTPDGATFKTADSDFLVSDNRDFHPTDLLEDADGSLLVVDTGGWYKLCCPTSQLYKPDVLGAIYRIRRRGQERPQDPRGLKIAWETLKPDALVKLLDHPQPAVQERAIQTIAKRDDSVTKPLAEMVKDGSPRARRNAIWAATRRNSALAREGLTDLDETVRQVSLHSLSVLRRRAAAPAIIKLLKQERSAHNRRAAAEALGRIGDATAVPALLEALALPADRTLEHALTYALIEIGDAQAVTAGLASDNARVRRAALVALDQMPDHRLQPESMTRALASDDAAELKSAQWILSRHPEWGDSLADYLGEQLAAAGNGKDEQIASQLAQFAHAARVQELVATAVRDDSKKPQVRQVALRSMARSQLKQAPAAWVGALAELLANDDPQVVAEAVAAAGALPLAKQDAGELSQRLVAIGTNAQAPLELRLKALSAVPGGLPEVSPELMQFLIAHVGTDQLVSTRTWAADVLSRAHFDADQLANLAGTLQTVGPLEADRMLAAFAQSGDEAVGRQLVAALKKSPIRSSLPWDRLAKYLKQYPAAVRDDAQAVLAAAKETSAEQKARLEVLLGSLESGDIRRGQAIFNSRKAACSACHAMGYLGGKVGPDLTRIGRIREKRDLLEAIVYPSASFVRSYEPVVIATVEGRVLNGLIIHDAADAITLVTGPDQQTRVPRTQIDEIQPSKVSVMPAGLDKQLTPRELADLVAFLKASQ